MSSEDKTTKGTESVIRTPLSRRDFLKTAGVAGLALGATGGLGAVAAACGGGETSDSASEGEGREIKIGFVSPLTGPLAAFGEADQFCVDQWNAAVKDGIATADGAVHPINIIIKDSQSDSNRAATVAGDLINNDGVDIMMVASTPDTVPPVADQCEAFGVPCVSNDCPWQAYFFGRGGDPENPFKWTYHSFWGSESAAAVFMAMWDSFDTNKKIGVMWPNDADGNAWADPETGMPSYWEPAGYTFVDPGRYQNGTEDFTSQISQFKAAGVDILNGVMIPPDFTNFWKQAYQQGLKPPFVTIAKALLFPSALEALGDIGNGLTTEVWWTPQHPYKSSLTDETSQQIGDAYESKTGKQWTQPIMHYAVFEVVADAIKRTENIDDKESIIAAVEATNIETISGPVSWSGGENNPVKNVSITPLVGGQWVPGEKYMYDLKIVSNTIAPDVPTNGELKLMEY
ncbi:MAG TPA: ABC transporter substrate-binding protein [Thermoleophilia bacterium]|nr:ABC transporter substrate-binding protein [Thermoleophilia bacterium]